MREQFIHYTGYQPTQRDSIRVLKHINLPFLKMMEKTYVTRSTHVFSLNDIDVVVSSWLHQGEQDAVSNG